MSKFSSIDSGATVLSKLNNTIVTVGTQTGADYICDGTADEVQIQAAIDYVSSLGGGLILIRNGTYNLSDRILFSNKSNIVLSGEGAGTVLQIPEESLTDFHYKYMIEPSAGSENIIIENIKLNGGYSSYTSPLKGYGGGISLGKKWLLRNCVISDFNYFGVWLGTLCVDSRVIENIFNGPGRGNDHIGGGGGYNVEIAGNTWESNCAGNIFDNLGVSYFNIHHNFNYSSHSIYVESSSYVNVHHNFMLGGNIISVSDAGYDFDTITNSRYINITDNILVGGGYVGHSTSTSATKECTISGNIKISGNQIITPSKYGILIHCGGNDVETWGGGYSVLDNIIIDANDDNLTTSNTGFGICNPSAINVMMGLDIIISNNICLDTRVSPRQRYGIQIGQTASPSALVEPNRVVVTSNEINGYVTNAINVASPTYTSNIIMRNNIGHVTEASGTGTIANGATTATITHGLSVTPTLKDITITLGENPTNTPGAIFVTDLGATTFVVNCENDPGSSGLDFAWKAIVL